MSDERETIHENLFYDSFYGSNELGQTLPEAIAWLCGLLVKVPPELHDQTLFEIESESDYDGGYSTALRISYWRPITDQEIAAREANEAARITQNAADQRARELATYAALKAKYG